MDNHSFVERYYQRLKLDPNSLDDTATLGKLQVVHERHLSEIPFENLSQHGAAFPATLEVAKTAEKVLDHSRGGFCYEVNTLLGAFLTALGYKVQYVPAHVCDPLEDVFGRPTHVILLVTTVDSQVLYADVGLGEPPLHPLHFGESWWNVEQRTPEGMVSKIHCQEGEDTDQIFMSWKTKDGTWETRLRWSRSDCKVSASLKELEHGLEVVKRAACIFSQKVVVTKCTRTEKRTLAGGGSRLKITGPPRFTIGEDSPVEIQSLPSLEDTRRVLRQDFGISLEATEPLDLATSLSADDEIFDAY